MSKIQAIKGMKDVLPESSPAWQHLEATVSDVFRSYGYKEIRFPIIEQTDLFKRGIGDATDIVEKEMYTFEDRDGDLITLRPEGTASCVRACEQHQLLFDRGNLTQKLWYHGPMFRHEKPQKGRLRQFHQFGVEAFGYSGPDIDAELLLITARLWRELGVSDAVSLQINSLGSAESRTAHRQALVDYFEQHIDQLDDDSKRRLHTNPLRIFDSKVESTRALLPNAPILKDYLDSESSEHFSKLLEMLDAMGIAYEVNPMLVRGLDYYSKTVFEWVTDRLGAQGTVCGGGRYDALIEQLGGRPSSAVGFGLGVERLLLLLEEMRSIPEEIYRTLDVYIVAAEDVRTEAFKLAELLREDASQLSVQVHCGGGNLRSQIKKADKSGALFALILGESEIQNNQVSVKFLREERDQVTVAQDELLSLLV